MALTEAQLVARRPKIGGSDAAAILGKDPYRTAHEVALRIRGEIDPDTALDDADHIFFGNEMEGVLARFYERKHKVELYTPEQMAHPKYPFIVVNIDRRIKGIDHIAIECKNTGLRPASAGEQPVAERWGAPGTNEVPERVYLQCMHGMMLDPALKTFHVLRCYGGNAYQAFAVDRNDEQIELLEQIEVEFYENVQKGILPEPDWGHRSTRDMIKRAFRKIEGTIEHMPKLAEWTKVWEETAAERLRLQKLEEGLKNQIEYLMGNTEIAVLPDGRKWKRKTVVRKPYTVEGSTYIECKLGK